MQTKTPILMLIAAFAFGQAVIAAPMTTREKLDTIILPKVQFEDAPLSVVIKYLKQRAKELDPEGKGINIILLMPSTNKAKPPVAKKPPADVAGRAAVESDQVPTKAKAAASSDVRVTMDFDNVPLGALIDYLCKGTGLKHRVEQHAITIAHQSVALDRMQTRVFPVGPGFLDAKRTR